MAVKIHVRNEEIEQHREIERSLNRERGHGRGLSL
jgi:hypothetical protein